MGTPISPERLAELHVQGREQAGRCRFVDPSVINAAKRILHMRGEVWAASVLLRPLERRSLIDSRFPWLTDGEPETLVLADAEEWKLLEQS